MRGADTFQEQWFTLKELEDFVPASHPLRPLREQVNLALVKLDDLFRQMYAEDCRGGRPSIAPEKLLRAMMLQLLYSVRSERQWIEQGFGWAKTVELLRQVKVRGRAKVDQCFVLAMTCYNLVRMRSLALLRQKSVQNAAIA